VTREQLIESLVACAYVERASAHVLLGWIPRVAELEVKLAIGRHQYAAIARSGQLERLIGSMSKIRGGHSLAVPGEWRRRMHAIDRAKTARQMVSQLYLGARAGLARCYRELRASVDPVLDAPLHDLVSGALGDVTEQLATARRWLRGAKTPPIRWRASPRGKRIARSTWLWPPINRVPIPARTPGESAADTVEGGGVMIPLVRPGRRSAAVMLHENIDAEVSTMELFARCSYEHPELPEDFHRDMARQTSDESRHAAACVELAARYGAPRGTWPISSDVYDFHYQFGPCKPGSRRELLWRLLLRSTVQEAMSIDGFNPLCARLAHDGAFEAARLLESLISDEVFHVESGLKWARYLCGGNDDRVFSEREKAHRYYVRAAQQARKQYVRANPDQAIKETEQLWELHQASHARYPFDLNIYLARDVRTSIGFTERDLEQVLDWGYARG
jgi:uncharacterized ferritin-like protein (DUF455 family)